jgi:hypothetical protein
MKELRREHIKRQDLVDNKIWQLLSALNPSQQAIEWNIEMIADVRERVRYWFTERLEVCDEMTYYPYIEE